MQVSQLSALIEINNIRHLFHESIAEQEDIIKMIDLKKGELLSASFQEKIAALDHYDTNTHEKNLLANEESEKRKKILHDEIEHLLLALDKASSKIEAIKEHYPSILTSMDNDISKLISESFDSNHDEIEAYLRKNKCSVEELKDFSLTKNTHPNATTRDNYFSDDYKSILNSLKIIINEMKNIIDRIDSIIEEVNNGIHNNENNNIEHSNDVNQMEKKDIHNANPELDQNTSIDIDPFGEYFGADIPDIHTNEYSYDTDLSEFDLFPDQETAERNALRP